jgi:hypothetical protein
MRLTLDSRDQYALCESNQTEGKYRAGKLTSILIAETEGGAVVEPATDDTHLGNGGLRLARRRPRLSRRRAVVSVSVGVGVGRKV